MIVLKNTVKYLLLVSHSLCLFYAAKGQEKTQTRTLHVKKQKMKSF